MEGRFFKDNLSVLGDVGVGTASPAVKLAVVGEVSGTSHAIFDGRIQSNNQLRVSNDYSVNYFYKTDNTTMLGYLLMRADNNSFLSFPAAQDFRILHGNTSRIAVKTDGNVGIGTTDPLNRLHIQHSAVTTDQALFIQNTNGGDAGIKFSDTPTGTQNGIFYYSHVDANSNGTDNSFHFNSDQTNLAVIVDQTTGNSGYYIGESSPVVAIRGGGDSFFNGGNVGIGTTSPGNYKLKVVGETHSTHFITGYDWTAKTGGLHIGNDGLTTGAISFYNGSNSSANIYRNSDILYVGARGGVNTKGLAIIADGNVGIGTGTPSTKLDVAGNARVTTDLFVNDQLAVKTTTLATSNNFHVSSGTTGSASKSSIALVSVADNSTYNSGVAALHVINSGNRGTKGHSSGSDLLRLEFSDSIHTVFNKDGNVGIGNDAPNSKLDVLIGSRSTTFAADNGTTWHDLIVRNPNNTLNAAVGLAFELNSTYHTNAAAGIAAVKEVGSSDYGAGLAFITRPQSAAAVERMRINTSGNLGINTTSPTSKLQVVGSTSGDSVLKVDGTNGTLFEVVDDLSDSLMSVNDAAGLPVFEVFADNHIVAGRYNQNDFYLDTNGKVGIGNSAPGDQWGNANNLVIGTNSGDNGMTICAGTSNEGAIFFADGASGADEYRGQIRYSQYSNYFVFAVNAAEVVRFNSNGSITSSTGASLTSGGAWTDASSRELKKDIVNLSLIKASQVVKLLNPVEFSYKAAPEERRVGFIAEDVPDLVASEGRKGLSSMQIVAALTKVVQNQQKEIKWCKEQIEKLTKIK